ncbi:MAG: hypothetical protein ABI036_11260 [Fibrobacteria bacterium]
MTIEILADGIIDGRKKNTITVGIHWRELCMYEKIEIMGKMEYDFHYTEVIL